MANPARGSTLTVYLEGAIETLNLRNIVVVGMDLGLMVVVIGKKPTKSPATMTVLKFEPSYRHLS